MGDLRKKTRDAPSIYRASGQRISANAAPGPNFMKLWLSECREDSRFWSTQTSGE